MKTDQEKIAVMQAAKEGKTIECRISNAHALSHWYEEKNPRWNWLDYDYRVKLADLRRVWVVFYPHCIAVRHTEKEALETALSNYTSICEFIEFTPEVKSKLGL